ncbi:RF-1 domain-containing protein [Lentinula aff. lateritia]|uniref:RF-1 domain-containing protein n=1 Tax=Lentinula aff. lateritia TaxID=2804960 RepID=A0ACC1UDF9_9AGAR|nr:RF-1 domain-containing protein [Lentinula aff. lateritia]
MSISAELKASARSAYRSLYRASSSIFGGDVPVLTAFRSKMREDALAYKAEMDPSAYEAYATQARDIAQFLRRNVVQATKLPEEETWFIRITQDTELGDNESVKNRSAMPSNRRATHTDNAAPAHDSFPPKRPMYYSALKRASSQRKIPELKEEDIEESFVRGSGPGGQSVNKTENNVQLLHKPTGIRVACQETRSLFTNRMLARRFLQSKCQQLDALENPGLSKEELKRAKQRERERRRRKKAKKKIQRKQIET